MNSSSPHQTPLFVRPEGPTPICIVEPRGYLVVDKKDEEQKSERSAITRPMVAENRFPSNTSTVSPSITMNAGKPSSSREVKKPPVPPQAGLSSRLKSESSIWQQTMSWGPAQEDPRNLKPAAPYTVQQKDRHGGAQSWRANVYARPYVPKLLQDMNFLPATVVNGCALPGINFYDYVASFAGRHFLMPHRPLLPLAASLSTSASLLTEANYETFFGSALVMEYEAEAKAMTCHNMYKVRLYSKCDRKNVQDKSDEENFYELQIPGIRENVPRVDLGDIILLRRLRVDPRTDEPLGMEQWLTPGGGRDRGFPAPGFFGIEYHASVWGLKRTDEKLLLKIEGYQDQVIICNIIFRAQPRRFYLFQRAIVDIDHQIRCSSTPNCTTTTVIESPQLDSKDQSNLQSKRSVKSHGDPDETEENASKSKDWMRRNLFPNQSDGVKQLGLPKGVFILNWFDKNLNYEQQKSVDSIQRQNYGSIPFLISGPPGTGKTKTVVETALQLIYGISSPDKHILLCAPSDPAADVLALRIIASIPGQNLQKDLLRLNSSSRSFAEVPEKLLPYCHVHNNLFSLPDFPKLMGYRMIVTSCRDADILVQARLTNRDIVHLQKGLFDSLRSGEASNKFKTPLHWNALLIDEAAQATEPEAGVPITVVAPPEEGSVGNVIVVMAGDHCQLGPQLFSQGLSLKTSLFERLFERKLYREHPLARNRAKRWQDLTSGPASASKDDLTVIRPSFSNLFRNYRSHAAILAIPSSLFYSDTLITEATDTDGMKDWSGWKGRHWPVLFSCNTGSDKRDLEGWGWYNLREIKKACDFAKSLVDEDLIAQQDICIMSPFHEQVQRLRHTIRVEPYKLPGVNIGPMEAFQGLESRFVIICTTRTQRQYLDGDHEQGLGIINEAKRFNVALTRAKQGLVVIGNPSLLKQDNSWNAFINFCWRHELWEDDASNTKLETERLSFDESNTGIWNPPDESTPPYISRLERALVYQEKAAGGPSISNRLSCIANEDDAMWVSGHAAEEVLLEY